MRGIPPEPQKGSQMKRFSVCVCTLAVLFFSSASNGASNLTAAAGAFYIPEDVIPWGSNPVSAFVQATIRRFNDSWSLAESEYTKAMDCASKMSESMLESTGQKMADALQAKAQEALEKAGGGLDPSQLNLPEDSKKELESILPSAGQ